MRPSRDATAPCFLAALLVLVGDASAASGTYAMDLDTLIKRVRTLDPALAARAAEELRAAVLRRRAEWDRVSGSVGAQAQEAIYQGGLAASEPTDASERELFDRVSANLSAGLVVPLFAGGALANNIEAQAARADAAHQDYERTRFDLEQAALGLYVALLASEDRLTIVQYANERAAAVLEIAKKRTEAGIGTDADVARADLNFVSQREALANAVGQGNEVSVALAAALVLEPDTLFVTKDKWDVLQALGDAAPVEALPEVRALEARQRAAAFDRNVAWAAWLPRLELFGDANYGNGTAYFFNGVPVDIGSSTERYGVFAFSYSAGMRLRWVGWDFFVTRDRVEEADALVAVSNAALADERRNAERRAGEARVREATSKARLEALSNGGAAAMRAVTLARARYEAGSSSLTDVLAVELEAVSVELRIVQARYDLAQGRLERLRAEGKNYGVDHAN